MCNWGCHRTSSLMLQPCLEHQYVPELVLPVAPTAQMLVPFLPDKRCDEITFIAQAALVYQIFAPPAKRASQPAVDRNAKSHLRSIDEFPRHVPVENLSQ